ADMGYLARSEAVARRRDPRQIMPEARTVLIVSASYAGAPMPPLPPLHGRVSRYAWGPPSQAAADYHEWLLSRLNVLVEHLALALGRPIAARTYVDTGPVLERAWAVAAGLGWTGKSTALIHPQLGSYTFLGAALLDVELAPSPRPTLPTCGTCTRCLEACPTGALVAPGVLDARRCLSYLTIENRGPIPEVFRSAMGVRVLGCDTCQEVCPWNRRPLGAHATDPVSPLATLCLPDLLHIDAEVFRARFRHTAIWRATPTGLARNAAIVLGNLGDPAARPHLARAAAEHPSAMVREHAAWALTQLNDSPRTTPPATQQ
ncbi:MAG: tRNA epoxyqueuosine(34) reductase QueG, partial [Anaerolineae bacterium]|nr:tRNA epoxyqueuosine(34) reductase QueG [Anaerolineae bacterium]